MIVGVLVRNEALKTVKRLAFWVTVLGYGFIAVTNFGSEARGAARDLTDDRTFALPDVWGQVLGSFSQAGLFFGSVLIIMLVANEFSWRTARQNVIDGLSKPQFFAAKMLLVPVIAVVFVTIQVSSGGIFAWLGTDRGAITEPLMSGAQWSAIGGIFLSFMGYGGLAMIIATTVRTAGGAIGMWFFYIAIIEQLLVGVLSQLGDWWVTVLQYAPLNVFNRLFDYLQHDPAAYQQAVQSALERGREAPELWSNGVLVGAAVGWIALLYGGAFFLFSKRDL